ncbi:MAG: hypothetical protein M3P23_04245 [Actinomycetota bacterium]|nr:hypothetical protein [Actinomycetota bacterium]
MSIDELARMTARRTGAAVGAASDPDASFLELVAIHRRRTQAKVVAVSATLLAVVLVVFVGTAGVSHHRAEPVAPKPSDTRPFRAAPPFCGPVSYGDSLSHYVDVGGACPTGPGRYLTVSMGYGTSPPFAFTLPKGWTIQEVGGVGGGDVMPALGGLLLRSSVTGDALVLAEYPTEVAASGRLSNTEGVSAQGIARRLAARSFVQPTAVVATKLGGQDGWRVNLMARPGAVYAGHCLIGDGCLVTFALARDPYPGRSYIGLVPNVPSTAVVVSGTTGIVMVAWTWGNPDVDQELAGLLASIDLRPPVVCQFDVEPCAH